MSRWLTVIAALAGCTKGDDGTGPGTTDTGTPPAWECVITEEVPEFSHQLGCREDYEKLAAEPYDSSIPGALSGKTIIDRLDNNQLWFQNSELYPIHWDFAHTHLSGNGLPYVSELGTFNSIEYYSPDRRFILGAVSYYEGPAVYAYELSPYDTADVDMITTAYRAIRDNSYFGNELYFHPTSTAIDALIPSLPDDIKVITTDELFAGIEYQPYNLGTTTGLLRFYSSADVDGTYTPYRELVVLDGIPNDISITAGIITDDFQTPLAHINVLSINRGTPNMGLKDAQNNPDLVALQDKWVELNVGPFEWTIKEITAEEAEAWWQEHKPDPIDVPVIDDTTTDLRDVEDIVIDGNDLASEIALGLTRFGSKGTNYSALYDIGPAVPIQDAYVIPFHYYNQHMEENGLRDELIAMMAKPEWLDPVYREEQLEQFKLDIVAAPLNREFLQMVFDKASVKFGGMGSDIDWRYRSSTNAEDLGTFTGAGIYNSQTGDPDLGIDSTADGSVEWAIKEAWANLWNPRAYEEREYYSIDQLKVGMALLATPNFPDEEANGVAVTNNIFDTSGLEPAFYVNVQLEDYEVVQPDLGYIPDAYLHYFNIPGSPVVYISHSNLIPDDETVLNPVQINNLGIALDAINNWFRPVYGSTPGVWYGMDVEFKFDDKNNPGADAELFIKQARPFPWDPSASGAAGR